MQSQALVNRVLVDLGSTKLNSFLSYVGGVIALALLAQVAIPLPWTPVPITGQTFGVTLIALLFGQKRAFSIVSTYIVLGTFSVPVFALAGASSYGYLFGMLLASAVVGHFADKGWTRSFIKSYFAGLIGSCLVFSCGLFWLSYFVPTETLLTAGLIPFLPGDLIKTVSAAFIASRLSR
ncbi:MAG: biotin transporter BioY [Bdellovibrionales bacterium]|nr:biotin transporter BioY [Bdellovibrionales bacterium]NQZ18946.1 biotin transporter BioY [Bdellovibrionales bacterium]